MNESIVVTSEMIAVMVNLFIKKNCARPVTTEELTLDTRVQDLFPGSVHSENFYRFSNALHQMYNTLNATVTTHRITSDYPVEAEFEVFKTLRDVHLYMFCKANQIDEVVQAIEDEKELH